MTLDYDMEYEHTVDRIAKQMQNLSKERGTG